MFTKSRDYFRKLFHSFVLPCFVSSYCNYKHRKYKYIMIEFKLSLDCDLMEIIRVNVTKINNCILRRLQFQCSVDNYTPHCGMSFFREWRSPFGTAVTVIKHTSMLLHGNIVNIVIFNGFQCKLYFSRRLSVQAEL